MITPLLKARIDSIGMKQRGRKSTRLLTSHKLDQPHSTATRRSRRIASRTHTKVIQCENSFQQRVETSFFNLSGTANGSRPEGPSHYSHFHSVLHSATLQASEERTWIAPRRPLLSAVSHQLGSLVPASLPPCSGIQINPAACGTRPKIVRRWPHSPLGLGP